MTCCRISCMRSPFPVNSHSTYFFSNACPNRGDDWADYPAASGGAGWPTQYQEVAPLCDAIVLDIKLFANLHNNPANDDTIGLPSTGRGLDPVEYKLLSYPIGKYDTEYDIGGSMFLEGKTNPEYFDYPVMLEQGGEVGDQISLKFTYNRPVRQYISYIGDKPLFPLPYAEPEAGCCERVDMPFEFTIVEEPPTDAPTPKKKKDKTKVKDSNGITRERKLRGGKE